MQKLIKKRLHKFLSIAVVLIFIIGLLPQITLPAHADTKYDLVVYVNGTNGNDSNSGSTSDTAFQTIATAITYVKGQNVSNPVIYIAADTYNENLTITQTISLIGDTADTTIIDGSSSGRVINITASNISVTVENLTIQKGKASNGGGIYCEGLLIMKNCIIKNNSVKKGTAGKYYNHSATNGGSGGNGGAIYATGDLNITGCNIAGNSAGNAGSGGSGNSSAGDGGSGGNGGAIYSTGSISITKSNITGNSAGNAGSGGGSNSGGDGGSGGNGGAIYSTGSISITRSNITGNLAGKGGNGGSGSGTAGDGGSGGSGGAIYATGDLDITGCYITRNSAGKGGSGGGARSGGDGGSGGSGGAIHTTGDLNITGCNIAGNSAGKGGSGYKNYGSYGTSGTAGVAGNYSLIYASSGSAKNNWWGSNNAPSTDESSITPTNYLLLTISAADDIVASGLTTQITVNLTKNNAGETVSNLFSGGTISFSANGTFDPSSSEFSAGEATATYTADTTGLDTITATLDRQSVTVVVVVNVSANLKNLLISEGTLSPDFNANKVVYTVDASDIDSIDITAVTEDSGATLKINGVEATSGTKTTVNLDNGANLIPIVVTAQDGIEKSYIISVNGTVSNTDLSSLSLSPDVLSFDATTSSYYVTVGSDVTSIDLTASTDDSKAVMLLDGAILSQNVTKSLPLSVGDSTVEIMVIAQDASTKTYTIIINRGTSDATLSGLSLSGVTLSPSFNRTTYAYTATVANAITSLTASPTAFDNASTVTVNEQDTTAPVNLSVGSNTVTIDVTGSDGVTTKTYTVTVTRQAEIEITNVSLPVSIVGGAYSVTMLAEGGDGSFTWSATGLPTALSLASATGILSGTPMDGDEGTYNVTITATDGNTVVGNKSYTLVVQKGCGNGAYLITSDGDMAYTGSYTADGIPKLTVNDGVSGFTYFGVDISAVTGHAGKEICVFVQTRNGAQVAFSFNKANYDTVDYSGSAFNVQAGDVILVYILDELTNDAASNPNVL